MQQLDLFNLKPINPVDRARGGSLDDQFNAFHKANPHVYQALKRLALQLARRGHRRIGIKMLFEVLRWQYAMSTNDPASDYKLNNNYTSFYARLLDAEPELRGMFELRTQRWQEHEVS